MITFENVDVVFPNGFQGLKGIDLTINQGEFVGIVGLSGAGKSTLIRAVNGLVPYTSGSLSVGETVVDPKSKTKLRRLRSKVGMIFQSFNLVNRISVLNNVLTGRSAYTPTWRSMLGWYRAADKELAFQCLERVGIVEKAYERASSLSGGQQQRVAIARVLAQDPEVMLADEPVAALDPPTAHRVMRDLRRIQRELGMTCIVNMHHLDLARSYADRIIGMRAGEVVFDGPVAEATDAVIEEVYQRSMTAEDVVADDVPVSVEETADATEHDPDNDDAHHDDAPAVLGSDDLGSDDPGSNDAEQARL